MSKQPTLGELIGTNLTKMKKSLIIIALLVSYMSSSMAQIVKETNEKPQSENKPTTTTETTSDITMMGLGYYTFDGFENWGLFGSYMKANACGFDLGYRGNFDDRHGNFNFDLGINYSFELYSKDKNKIFFTLAAGPSFRLQDEFKGIKTITTTHKKPFTNETYETTRTEEQWDEDQFNMDAYLNARLTIQLNNIILSGGYFYWAPEFKFGSDYKADGWAFSLGLGI